MAQTSSYDVVVGTIATVMRVTRTPSQAAEPGGEYSFAGVLETTATPAVPVEDETVTLLIDTVPYSSVSTDPAGNWALPFHLEPGPHDVMAVFAGTAEYDASMTPTYPLDEPKIGTEMIVFTAPPATAAVGVPFTFDGSLWAPGPQIQIEGATVNLYVDAAVVDSTTTITGGEWQFGVLLATGGTHAIYAEFPGDATYQGCAKKFSGTKWLPAGLLAVAGGLAGIAWLGR